MSRDFLCYLVTLQYVLECLDLESELIRNIEKHQDLARYVTVSMNVALAFEHFDERFQLQISPRWNQIFLTLCHGSLVFVPGLFVVASAAECVTNGFFNTHARIWVTTCDSRLIRST